MLHTALLSVTLELTVGAGGSLEVAAAPVAIQEPQTGVVAHTVTVGSSPSTVCQFLVNRDIGSPLVPPWPRMHWVWVAVETQELQAGVLIPVGKSGRSERVVAGGGKDAAAPEFAARVSKRCIEVTNTASTRSLPMAGFSVARRTCLSWSVGTCCSRLFRGSGVFVAIFINKFGCNNLAINYDVDVGIILPSRDPILSFK